MNSVQFEGLTICKTDDSLLPLAGSTCIGATLAAQLASVVGGADTRHLFAEQLFHSLLDLQLVGTTVHLEGDFVVDLLKESGLLAEADVFDDLVTIFHDLGSRGSVLGAAMSEGLKSIAYHDH